MPFPYNHLGPYVQNSFVVINAPLIGEVSAVSEVDQRGNIQDIVLGSVELGRRNSDDELGRV